MGQSVGLAMIVRDSSATLARCLESVASGVDEIVIVDTGSCDDTPNIARRFTDRLYEFPWCDDFSAARQYAFDRVRSDWAMWLDADDRVSGAASIRPTLEQCGAGVDVVHWKYIAGRDGHGNSRCEFWRERCVRNDGNWTWAGKVHELLVPRKRSRALFSANTAVFHERGAAPRDPSRNLRILRKEYAKARCGAEPRLLLHMAMELVEAGDESSAEWFLERFIETSRWLEQNYFAGVKLAELLCRRGQFPAALAAARAAHNLFPHWPNACFSMAHIHSCKQDWRRVVEWSERGARLAAPDTVCVVDPLDWQFRWIGRYTSALMHYTRYDEARRWSCHALGICPGDPEHLQKLKWLEELLEQEHSHV